MPTLYVLRDTFSTVYFYGAMMVIVFDAFVDEVDENIHTHQYEKVSTADAEANNKLLWERW